jgi:hypothetical protein
MAITLTASGSAAATGVDKSTFGITNVASGTFLMDATSTVGAFVFQTGFTPRFVKFINLTDRIQDEWFDGMTADYSLHTVAAGTVTLATSGGISIDTVPAGSTNNTTIVPFGTLSSATAATASTTPILNVAGKTTPLLYSGSAAYTLPGSFSIPAALIPASKHVAWVAFG